ncbi:MAG: nucleotidyltransferase family protein [Myxococcales bacterium]|nr:nucleotidyltransferase family protein [Myxococcales bacterium]
MAPSADLEAWGRHLAAREALRQMVAALGVDRVMPVKGVVTARWLYDDVIERPVVDLDVRVRRSDVARVAAEARARGWTIERSAPEYDNLVLDLGGMGVDVEAAVGPPGLCARTVDALFEDAVQVDELFGFAVLAPELHDHALLLAINAFKDKLAFTSDGCREDLARVVRLPTFDPGRLARLARRSRVAAVVWIVADWLADASDGWRAVRGALGPAPPRRLYVALAKSLISRAPLSLAARLVARAGSDDPRARLRALRSAVAWQLDVWRGPSDWRREGRRG